MSYRLGIDIGGTFTDTVLMGDEGEITTYKSPTTPDDLLQGLINNAQLASEDHDEDLRGFLEQVEYIGHGTTAATNDYIEREGAQLGLITTRGFEDIIFQQRMMGMTAGLSRDEVTDYANRREPEPLVPWDRVYGVRERVDYKGEVLTPLQEQDVVEACESLNEQSVEAVAVCLLWSFKHPDHEHRVREIVQDILPGAYVSLSSELVPRLGEYERTATTLANAYLGPVISRYTDTLEQRLEEEGYGSQILLLDSTGGMMTPESAGDQPVRLLMSGPAGGLTGSEYVGSLADHENILTFDMGGTSTDVGLIHEGEPVQKRETVLEKYHLLQPTADIRSIGAGGGSIAWLESDQYLQVGPKSAGADPGPVCYGRGGTEPTVTDADLVLGILNPDNFLGGRIQLDEDGARRSIREHIADPLGMSVEEAAAGIKRIVDNQMADLLRTVTVEEGYDPAEFVLYAYGGAGPTHAPSFSLDVVDKVLIPATHTVHSAMGAIASDLNFVYERSEPTRLSLGDDRSVTEAAGSIEDTFERLRSRADREFEEQNVEESRRAYRGFVEMRYPRQTRDLRIPLESIEAIDGDAVRKLIEEFQRTYVLRYGEQALPDTDHYELVTFSLEARGAIPQPQLKSFHESTDSQPEAGDQRSTYDPSINEFVDTDVYDGHVLNPGHRLAGPAVIEYPGTTVAVPGHARARVDAYKNLLIQTKEDAS